MLVGGGGAKKSPRCHRKPDTVTHTHTRTHSKHSRTESKFGFSYLTESLCLQFCEKRMTRHYAKSSYLNAPKNISTVIVVDGYP